MGMKAKVVMPLVKPVPTVLSSTLNYFTAEWLKDLEVGYQVNTGYTTTGMMKHVYGKIEYFWSSWNSLLLSSAFTWRELESWLRSLTKFLELKLRKFNELVMDPQTDKQTICGK